MKTEEMPATYIEILKDLSGEQRLKEGMELYELAMNLTKASIKKDNPNISPAEMALKLKSRIPQ